MQYRFLLILSCMLYSQFLFSQGSIGVNTNAPDASALLHLESKEKGLLIPRLNKVDKDAILNPAQGLLVYQLDDVQGFYVFENGDWDAMKPTSSLSDVFTIDEDGNIRIANRDIIITNTQPIDNNGTPRTTSRLVLESWERSNRLNDHAGDLIQLMWRDPQAKPFIGWWDYTGEEPILKAWIGAHDIDNSGVTTHGHISIETSDSNGEMQTRMDFDYDKDTTEIKTSTANFTVGGQHKFRASGPTTLQGETTVDGEMFVNRTMTTKNITLLGTGGTQRQLALQAAYNGDYASTIRFTGESSGNEHYRGGYIQYDASGNQIVFGSHNVDDMDINNDIEVLRIPRDGSHLEIVSDLKLGNDSRISSVNNTNGIGISPSGAFVFNTNDASKTTQLDYSKENSVRLLTNQNTFRIQSTSELSPNFEIDFPGNSLDIGFDTKFNGLIQFNDDVKFHGGRLDMNNSLGSAGQVLKRKGDHMIYAMSNSVGNVLRNGTTWSATAQCLVVTGISSNVYAAPGTWSGEDGDVLTLLNKSSVTQEISGHLDNVSGAVYQVAIAESVELIWDQNSGTWWLK